MTYLDEIWRKYAALAGVLAARPDFRSPPAKTVGVSAGTRNAKPGDYAEEIIAHPDIDRILADLVIEPDLSAAIAAGEPDACRLAFELIGLGAPVDAMVSNFSCSNYLSVSLDLAKAKVDPILHYLRYGFREGRRTLVDLRKTQHHGRAVHDPNRPTCLIIVHELSRTGAPIVGLDLVREASESHNVIVACLRGGELLDDFLEYACELIITSKPDSDFLFYTGEIFLHIDFAVANSIGSFPYLNFLVAREIPFAAYIHDYAEYVFPVVRSANMALFADLMIFSSDHLRNSWSDQLRDIEFDLARDTMILPQRVLTVGAVSKAVIAEARSRLSLVLGRDLSNVRLICGAGTLSWRKGTDIFGMTAAICRKRNSEAIFIWVGDGLNREDTAFGAYMNYQLNQIEANKSTGNLFLLPAGSDYPDVLTASDALFLSSRLDPLPNVVFDAAAAGCRIVSFQGASGFCDSIYSDYDQLVAVDYCNPEAAANALLGLPLKHEYKVEQTSPAQPNLFYPIWSALKDRLDQQRYFVKGVCEIDLPILFTADKVDRDLRVREREKIMRYGRRFIWRDLNEVEEAINTSQNWIHRKCRLAQYGTTLLKDLPSFSVHIHTLDVAQLGTDLDSSTGIALAHRIVVTTDTETKKNEIEKTFIDRGLKSKVIVISTKGRGVLCFMDLFRDGGVAGDDDIWLSLHQPLSSRQGNGENRLRESQLRLLLGDLTEIADAVSRIGQDGVGLVAPFSPYHGQWNASRALLPQFASQFPEPLPQNPLLFPDAGMFWVRRSVVSAMNMVFGQNYPWPNDTGAVDGSEYQLIERLWPAVAAKCGLDAIFVCGTDWIER